MKAHAGGVQSCLLPPAGLLTELQVTGGGFHRNQLFIAHPREDTRPFIPPQGLLRPPHPGAEPHPSSALPTALSDPAAKENCMMHLLRTLPDPNLITFLFLLEHLKR